MSTTAYNQTFTGDQNLTVPDNARDVYVDMVGGRGGIGGNGGGSRGLSRRGKFLLPGNFIQRALKLRPGSAGSNGAKPTAGNGGDVSGSGDGGNGASGAWSSSYQRNWEGQCNMNWDGTCPNDGGAGSCAKNAGSTQNVGCQSYPGGCCQCQSCIGTNYTSGNAGGGAGGGALSALYINNVIAVVCGGGGGGGGGPGDGNGANTSQFQAGAINSLSNGSNGSSRGSNGGTGGGGGSALGTAKAYNQASISRYNNNLVTLSTNYGLTASNGTSGNGYINVQWTALQPEITAFSSNHTSLIRGGNPSSFTFTFNIVDFVSATLTGPFGANGSSVDVTYSPGDNLTYTWTPNSGEMIGASITLTAVAGSATDTSSINVDVYEPVVAVLDADSQPVTRPIIIGQSADLEWQVNGTADTASINQGIGSVSLNNTTTVSPNSTTTYTLSASGDGGSDTDNVTVVVYQIPTISVTIPTEIDYGDDLVLDTTTEYANLLVSGTYVARYLDGSEETFVVNGSTNAAADQPGELEQDLGPDVIWNDWGPYEIDVVIAANGSGGNTNQVATIEVIIDMLPDNIGVPDSREAFPSDEVESPDDDTVLSDPIEVTGIDIPVEIKASQPIQVRFDDDDPDLGSSWKNVRSL